jgi:hypothetical protein
VPLLNLSQIIGFVAIIFSVAVFQFNNRRTMLLLQTFAAILYCTHFSMLGAYTGAAINLVGVGRNYVYFRIEQKQKLMWILLLFIGLFTLSTVLTWQGIISLLPLGGSIAGTIAFWQSKTKNIRRLGIIAPPLWFTYNTISGSYPGMLVEVFMLISNFVGMYRFDRKVK